MQAEILIPISLFAMIYGIVYLAIRRKERMALIEKGLSADFLDSRKRYAVPSSLKWGMLAVGVGLGILVGRILAANTCLGEEESFFSMVFLFGGVSLIIYHFIAMKMEKENLPPRE